MAQRCAGTATASATCTALGTACAGPSGAPELSPLRDSLPWSGDSKTSWGSLALPFDLGLLGMPGSTLQINP